MGNKKYKGPKRNLPKIDHDKLAKEIGYVPNNWQQEVDKTDARFLNLCIGRRGGKTHFAARSPYHGVAKYMVLPEQHVWIVAPNYDLTQRLWEEVKLLANREFKNITKRFRDTKGNYYIETVLGTRIEAKSADDPEMLIGVGLDHIIMDEAARVKEKAWYQALRPTLADHKGSATFISTPKGYNWFHDMFQKGQDPEEKDYASFQYSSYENNYIDPKEIDDMSKDMPDYEYRQEILAQFESSIQEIFKVEKIKRLQGFASTKKEGMRTMGVDLGKSISYTVITVLESDGSCSHFERFQGDWQTQIEKIQRVQDKFKVPYVRVDATGKGDPIVEQMELSGVPIEPFIFTDMSKKQLLDKLSLAIERGLISLPEHEEIIFDELKVYGKERTRNGNEIYKPLKQFTDDCVMSLALAVWDMDIDMFEDNDIIKPGSVFAYPEFNTDDTWG